MGRRPLPAQSALEHAFGWTGTTDFLGHRGLLEAGGLVAG